MREDIKKIIELLQSKDIESFTLGVRLLNEIGFWEIPFNSNQIGEPEETFKKVYKYALDHITNLYAWFIQYRTPSGYCGLSINRLIYVIKTVYGITEDN